MNRKAKWPKPLEKTGPWIFKIEEDFTYQSKIKGVEFDSEWLQVKKDGSIVVKGSHPGGYTWDGCTPKLNIFDLFVVGTPDGRIDVKTMKPKTYYASLVHDALYQYLHVVPIDKKEIDLLFLEMLGDFKLRKLYYWAVKHFGGRS